MESFLQKLAGFWKPHPGQLRFLMQEAKTRVLACGRRWGKTDACAALVCHHFLDRQASNQILVAPTLDQAKILFKRVVEFLDFLLKRPIKIKHSPYPQLEEGGSSIVARSGHVARSLRGHGATHIVVDEAAYVDPRLIQDTLSPMLATGDGELTLISTPSGFNAFQTFFSLGQQGKFDIWSQRASTGENPHVSREFLAVQRQLSSERTWAVEYEAQFMDDEGAVFRSDLIDAALIPDVGQHRGPYCIGIDWARYSDYTVLVVLSGTHSNAKVVDLKRLNGLSWMEQIEALLPIIRQYPTAPIVMDTTGEGDVIFDMIRPHLSRHPLRRFTFTHESKRHLIEKLVGFFERRALKFTPNEQLDRELRAFRWRNGRLEGKGEHDDMVVALALATYDLPQEYGNSVLRTSRTNK